MKFDFLPSLSFGDSFYNTVKPDRKNVLTGVNISIMPCATLCTSPFSYSKTCSTFRTTRHIATARTSLGSVFFIHDFKTATCILTFVGQLPFEFKPTCIVNRFSEFVFFIVKLIGFNITNNNQCILLDQPCGEFMLYILPCILILAWIARTRFFLPAR